MKTTIIIYFILVKHFVLLSQNLVVNPDIRKSSDTISDLVDNNEGLRGFGTVDFYHPSAEKNFPWLVPPHTFNGFAYPKCGDGFGGFAYYFFKDMIGNDVLGFEHIQFSLKEELCKNKLYNICFYIKLANHEYAGKNVGVLFTKESNFVKCSSIKYGFGFVDYLDCFEQTTKAHIEITDPKVLIDTTWTKVTATYKAQGGEKYMTIGVFWQENKKIIKAYDKAKKSRVNSRLQNKLIKVLKYEILVKNPYKVPPTTQWSSDKEKGAYYFIDCVSVELTE